MITGRHEDILLRPVETLGEPHNTLDVSGSIFIVGRIISCVAARFQLTNEI